MRLLWKLVAILDGGSKMRIAKSLVNYWPP
jgi:hypothetical protein